MNTLDLWALVHKAGLYRKFGVEEEGRVKGAFREVDNRHVETVIWMQYPQSILGIGKM